MKILIISQHIFPMQTPRAHRTTELMKEFARQGHEVTVYAVLGKYDYSEFERETGIKIRPISIFWQLKPITSDGYRSRSILDKFVSRIVPKRSFFPVIELKKRVEKILLHEELKNFDLLLSVADPHSIHWGVSKAKLQSKSFPVWIGDCGDPFMMNGKALWSKKFDNLEREFLANCDAITVPVEQAINEYYPEFRKKIKIVPQGFDNSDIELGEYRPQNIPRFAYAGSIYNGYRSMDSLIDLLVDVETAYEFHVYSPNQKEMVEYSKRLNGRLIYHAPVGRKELIQNLSTMDFLINIENVDLPGQIPSKLIDYSLTKRPILSVLPSNIDRFKVLNFIKGNYKDSFLVSDISSYEISNVVQRFIDLYNELKLHQ
jgi:hypothetical protein